MPLNNQCRDQIIELVKKTIVDTTDYIVTAPAKVSLSKFASDSLNAIKTGLDDWSNTVDYCSQ